MAQKYPLGLYGTTIKELQPGDEVLTSGGVTVTGAAKGLRVANSDNGYSSLSSAVLAAGGLKVTSGAMNTTAKYVAPIVFGTTDADFTTTNPKWGAAFTAYATEAFTADTAGGMGLEFFGTPNTPGTAQPTLTSLGTWTTSGLNVTGGLSATTNLTLNNATTTGLSNGEIGFTNSAALRWRNGANSAYLNAMYVSNLNDLVFGGSAVNSIVLSVAGSGIVSTVSSTGLSTTGLNTTNYGSASGATFGANQVVRINSASNVGYAIGIPSTGGIVGGYYVAAGTNTYDGGFEYQGTTRTLSLRAAGTNVVSVTSGGLGVTGIISGTGQIITTANNARMTVNYTTTGGFGAFDVYRSGVVKGYIGLDASDNFRMTNGGGVNGLYIDATSGAGSFTSGLSVTGTGSFTGDIAQTQTSISSSIYGSSKYFGATNARTQWKHTATGDWRQSLTLQMNTAQSDSAPVDVMTFSNAGIATFNSGVVTASGNGALAFSDTSATTGFKAIRLRNTTGGVDLGVQDSAGTWCVGASANDGLLVGKTGLSFSANDGAATQMRLTSAGLSVTGTGNFTGNVTASNGIFSTNRTDNTTTEATAIYLSRGNASGTAFNISTKGDAANGVSSFLIKKDGTTWVEMVDGTFGLGHTPSSWTFKALEIGYAGNAFWSSSQNDVRMSANLRYNGGYKYVNTGAASNYVQSSGAHLWYNAASGTAGNAISFTQAMTLDGNGNLILGGVTSRGRFSSTLSDANTTFSNLGYGMLNLTNSSNTNNNYSWMTFAESNGNYTAAIGSLNEAHSAASSTVVGSLVFATKQTGVGGFPVERMRIDSVGNLGLGVTPSAWQAAYKTIDINTLASLGCEGTSTQLATNAYYNAGWKYKTSSYATDYEQYQGKHTWYTAPSGTAGAAITFTQAMTLDASGNLLVGTTSNASTAGLIHAQGKTDSTAIGAHAKGTTSNSVGYYCKVDSANALYAYWNCNGVNTGSISTSGTTTAYNTSSDYRLKNIDSEIDGAAAVAYINKLRPVQGSWKADGSRFIGLIAHEAQEVSETQVVTGEKDGEEMQAMDYSSPEIIANLIAAVQYLSTKLA